MNQEMTSNELQMFIDLVYKHTGIQMHEGKRALLTNRLNKRMRDLHLRTYQDYYKYLTQDRDGKRETCRFIDAVTTNETYFFRADKTWAYFTDEFLPEWSKNKSNFAELRIWCAAASSGEEPYTIAMLCEEHKKKDPSFKWKLYCSDISEEMLDKCKQATYKGRSIAKIPKPMLRDYFDKLDDENYQVKSDLIKKINFFQHKLQETPKHDNFQIVFLRNVMIYFDAETKMGILEHMHKIIKKDGMLILGETEGLINLKANHLFKYFRPSIYTHVDAE